MSEIQRYAVNQENDLRQRMLKDVSGEYVSYTDLLRYRRWYIFQVALNAMLLALLVYYNAFHSPVTVPMGAGEKAEMLKEVHAAKVAKDQAQADLRKAREDYVVSQAFFADRAKELEQKIAKDIQGLESPTARGQEMDRMNKERAQHMSTHEGLVLEAKRVLGVSVKVVE